MASCLTVRPNVPPMLNQVNRNPKIRVVAPSINLKKFWVWADSGVVRARPMTPPMMIPAAFRIAPVTCKNEPRPVSGEKCKVDAGQKISPNLVNRSHQNTSRSRGIEARAASGSGKLFLRVRRGCLSLALERGACDNEQNRSTANIAALKVAELWPK